MKYLTRRAGELNGTRKLALSILARLPSGWTALVALSKEQMKSDPQAALEYANRAIQMNPTVWQGHRQRVATLERLNEGGQARQAQLLATLLMSTASLERMIGYWFPEVALTDRVNAARLCSVDADALGPIMADLAELPISVTRTGEAMEILIAVYGLDEIATLAQETDLLSETQALALARLMRESGAVNAPLALLEKYAQTEAIADFLVGPRQDAKVMSGTLDLEIRRHPPYEPRRDCAFYLLHNSLPQKSGGYAARSHGLIRALENQDWDIVAITRPGFPSRNLVFDQDPKAREIDVVDGISYRRLLGKVDRQPRSDLQGFVNLYADALAPLIRRHRPAIIHAASNWWNGFGGVSTAREYGVPSVYEIRGLWEVTRSSRLSGWESTEMYDADSSYEAEAARLADRVIVITKALRDEMISRGVLEDKIHIVPNAVDPERFSRTEYDYELATELGLQDEVVIGFAGSLTFYEGLDDLLRAGALVRERTTTPFKFLFVGDGPVLMELKSLADEVGLSQRALFVGRVPHDEVGRYLSLMAITPFPRKPLPVSEMVSPLKPLESMLCEAAIVASDVRALSEMVPDGTGLTFEKGNIEDLADKLQLLIEDTTLRAELTANAYEWVVTERTWDVVSREISDIYRQLLDT